MFLQTTGIILVLCLWNVFVVVVEGQSSCGTTVGTCKKLLIVHQRYGWQTYTHYIIVHYSCDIPCINGNWGSWSPFSDAGQCSVTCCQGTVTQRRTRECNNPPPSGGGAPCPGADTETRTGSCGSNDNQCPLTCVAADLIGPTRFGDTCVICVNRYYQCNNLGPPDEMFCGDGSPGSLVWSVNLNTCIAPAACIAQGG